MIKLRNKPQTIKLWSRWFVIDYAHQLTFLGPDHKCARLHGHSSRIKFQVGGDRDANGMMIDYGILKIIWKDAVHDVVDHRYLNEIPGLEKPTAERLAEWCFERLQPRCPVPILKVRVREGYGGEAVWKRPKDERDLPT